ncbi:hypothetical protein A8V01_23955 [Novosphingobium guangzhouense]|uniref:Uncharacterized protein n=1 Tax=Novosphingobium guangzhouense TaxID=1850347 RepID=A0A2K2FWY4_9SPHN|nr:hypothetical protein A8V01_23955 [Novosphingobium guangzhouense]
MRSLPSPIGVSGPPDVAGAPSLPGIRSLAVLLSTTIAVALLFGLLFIHSRSELVLQRQQTDFGEVGRMVSELRDLGDMVARRTSTEGQSDGGSPSGINDRYQVWFGAGDDCAHMAASLSTLRLRLDGFQARDRKPVLSALASPDGRKYCAHGSAQPVLQGRSDRARAQDLAIVGPDGEVLLVLRGDWPRRIEAADPDGQRGKGNGGQGDGRQGDAAAAAAAGKAGQPPAVTVGGRERLVYQWPLDFGRPLTIEREEGPFRCTPRLCMLSALGDPPSATEVLNTLSPFTKAAFGFAVVVLLLLIPLIKLASIDHNASLGWLDVIGIIAAVPLMVATLVTACAVIAFWGDLRRNEDAMVRGLANSIAQDIDREVGLSLSAMEHAARQRWGDWSRMGRVTGANRTPGPAIDPPWQLAPGPLPLIMLQLRDVRNGIPMRVTQSRDRPIGDIRERRYFGRLRASPFPCGRPVGRSCAQGHSYAVDQVPASATGDARMVLLLTAPNAQSLVMAGKPPAATLAVPVPAGFGYAVIDPASLEVLQHSDPARVHNETFGSQLDTPATLTDFAASVDTRCGQGVTGQETASATPFDARYAGRRVRMSVSVSCSARWLVATWYDRSQLQDVALEPAYVAGITMLCIGVLLAAMLGILAVLDPHTLLRKLWPDPEPFHSAEPDEWYLRGMSAQLAVVVLMPLGLLLVRGDALFLHAGVGLFLLLILLARKDADHSWGALPVGWGKGATVFYVVLGIAATIVLAQSPGAGWRVLAYPVLLVVMWLVSAIDWFATRDGAPDEEGCGKLSRAERARRLERRIERLGQELRLPVILASAGFVPPSVMRRANRVLRHQLVTIYLLAVIPTLAACSAAAGQLRVEHSHGDARVLEQSRHQVDALVAQVQSIYYRPARPAQPPPADLSTRKLVADHAAARSGAPSLVACEIMRLWDADSPCFTAPLSPRLPNLSSYAAAEAARTGHLLVTMPPGDPLIAVRDWLLAIAAMALATFLTWRLLELAAQNLFGLQHFGFRALHPRHTPEQIRGQSTRPIKAVFINYPTREFRNLQNGLEARDRLEMFDLALERNKLGEKSMALLAAKSWIVTGFESIVANRDLRVKALGLLEQLTARREVNVYFFVETMPLVRLRQARDREKREAEAAGTAGIMNESESYRWAELFSEFITYTWTEALAVPVAPGTAAAEESVNLRRLLALIEEKDAREAVERWSRRNPAVADLIANEMIQIPSDRIQEQIRSFCLSEKDVKGPTPAGQLPIVNDLRNIYSEQVHEYMANFLGDYYQGEWVRSSKEEHLTLHHLAHGKFINTSNFPVLNSLLSRRLVKTDPNFRLMNESFGHWIRTLEHPDWFLQFRQDAQRGGAWHMLRVPLMLLVAAGSVLITFLDHGGSGSLLTLAPGVVATMPILLSRFTRPLQANG